jgi:hypothetical protein
MNEGKALVVLLQGILADKISFLLALLTSAGGFAWCLHDPDWIRYAAATTYSCLTYLAVRPKETSNAQQN